VTFYVPHNPVAVESSKLARDAVQRLGVQLIERHVGSIEELQVGVRALKAGDADALFQVQDAMVNSQYQLIIDTAKVKRLPRLPTMLVQQNPVTKGGLASYAVSFHEVGRLSAKYVHRVLAGANPKDLPVEGVDKIDLVINLQTAKQIGLTIPPNVLARADKVIK
jgi:putative ABC transport system substrate-binding protein